jgi:hypothetical protein
MTPEEIKVLLSKERHELQAHALDDKKGYSFWFGVPARFNRIIRVSRRSPSFQTKLRLAVTDRASRREFTFAGTAAELLEYVDQEIRLYQSRVQSTGT